jgi:hypothetical protein
VAALLPRSLRGPAAGRECQSRGKKQCRPLHVKSIARFFGHRNPRETVARVDKVWPLSYLHRAAR